MNERISNFRQVASISRYVLSDGKESGLEVLDCNNGKIRFLLNVSRALDIMQLYHYGENISFISKNGFINQETPFINRFEGGMVYTCGLDNMGRREGFVQHGTFHVTPALVTRTECDENGILVEALISDTALFGKNLAVKRKIFTSIGAEYVTLEDTLINQGYRDEEYCVLYHVNLGYPLLQEGSKIEADVKKILPTSSWAEQNVNTALTIEGPVKNQEETCYYLDLKKPQISLVNDKYGKKFTLSYSADTLPCFLEWKSMASGDYALGLEPCTSFVGSQLEPKIVKAGNSVTFSIKLQIEKI